MPLEAHELLRRFLLHIVPHGFQRWRHGGFLANRCKARALRQCRHWLGQPTNPPPRETPSAVEWMRQRTGIDLTQCPHCGHGPLVRPALPPLTARGASRKAPQEGPIMDSSCPRVCGARASSEGTMNGPPSPPRGQCGSAAPGTSPVPVTRPPEGCLGACRRVHGPRWHAARRPSTAHVGR
jgi:hypothetical protein